MKKIIIILSAIIAVCCCSKEQSVGLLTNDNNNGIVSFTATFEGAGDSDTKVGINTNGHLCWVAGDAIAVELTDGTFATFTLNTSTMKFTASLGDKKVKDGGKAYYPASIATSSTSVTLPDTYAASVSDGLAIVECPMVGTVNLGASSLNLTHLGGILSIAVSHVPADATKMILTATGKDVTGTFSVADSKITAGTTGTNKTVTLTFNAGDFGNTATEFFIPVPVTTFDSGFTVDFKNASNESLYSNATTKTSISVARAHIKRMAELTVPAYIYISDNTGDTWENVKVYAKNSSAQFTSAWPGNDLSGDSFTHNGHTYQRIEIPAAQLGVSGGEITVSGTAVGSTGDGTRDYVRVGLYNQTFSSDVYYYVSTTTPSKYRLYMEDQTGDYNLHLHIYGISNTPSTTWPGVTVSGLNSVSLDNGLSTKYYIETNSGNNFKYTVNNNGSDNNKSDQDISADKNYIYYMTIWKSGEENWWYAYSFLPCAITQE